MSALLKLLASTCGNPADADAVLLAGLPGPRSESWKYTPLRALERRAFAPAESRPPDIPGESLAHIPAPRIVFVNGVCDESRSDLTGLCENVVLQSTGADDSDVERASVGIGQSDTFFARTAKLCARDGLLLLVHPAVASDVIVNVVFIGAPANADQVWNLRSRIVIGAGARLSMVEHHMTFGPHAHLANSLTMIELEAGAWLTHARIHRDAEGGTSFQRSEVVLREAARYERLDLELSGALSRHELDVRLEGEGASIIANGVLLAQGRSHVETRLNVEHIARSTTCDLSWRGLALDRARVVFHGGIIIHSGADGSNAALSSKNLLISDSAEVDAQPVLEIHADEVKAAHGATVGRLDPVALFYLRSRGLSEPEARNLMTVAFSREPLSMIADAGLRAMLTSVVDAAVSGSDSA